MSLFKESLTAADVAGMIDLSAVQAHSTDHDVTAMVEGARRLSCFLVTTLPSRTGLAKALIAGKPTPKLGGNVGFPSGGQTTSVKVKETRELVALGVDEIDAVMDVGAHISGRYDDVYRDMAAVVDASDGRPVKVVLECAYLTDHQIRTACDLAVKAGAVFVKTGTGWASSGATLESVALIKSHVGDSIQIKASGGIRGADTLFEMYRRGARRFGISHAYVGLILEAFTARAFPAAV